MKLRLYFSFPLEKTMLGKIRRKLEFRYMTLTSPSSVSGAVFFFLFFSFFLHIFSKAFESRHTEMTPLSLPIRHTTIKKILGWTSIFSLSLKTEKFLLRREGVIDRIPPTSLFTFYDGIFIYKYIGTTAKLFFFMGR